MPLPSIISSNSAITPETNFVRLRGLPFSATEDDIRNFLDGIAAVSITFTVTAKGRASGECYVELNDTGAVKDTLVLHKKEMSGRYIEVFSVSEDERNEKVRLGVLHGIGENAVGDSQPKFVVRLRGIPYATTGDDIRQFFSDFEVTHVLIDRASGGRPSGQAYAEFANKADAEKALEKNRSYLGNRYVEVFRSSEEEMANSLFSSQEVPPPLAAPIPLRDALNYSGSSLGNSTFDEEEVFPEFSSNFGPSRFGGGPTLAGPIRGRPAAAEHRPGPYSRSTRPTGPIKSLMSPTLGFNSPTYGAGSSGGSFGDISRQEEYETNMKTVFIRGLPFNVSRWDIEQLFKPYECVEVKLGHGNDGRPTGDGYVTFTNEVNAFNALTRSGSMMGSRYIEVFPSYELHPVNRNAVYMAVGNGGRGDANVSLANTPSARTYPAPTSKPIPLLELCSFGAPFSKPGARRSRESNEQGFANSDAGQQQEEHFEQLPGDYERPFWNDVSVKSTW